MIEIILNEVYFKYPCTSNVFTLATQLLGKLIREMSSSKTGSQDAEDSKSIPDNESTFTNLLNCSQSY